MSPASGQNASAPPCECANEGPNRSHGAAADALEGDRAGLVFFCVYESRTAGWLAALSDEETERGRAADPQEDLAFIPCAAFVEWPADDPTQVAFADDEGLECLLDWCAGSRELALVAASAEGGRVRIGAPLGPCPRGAQN